MKLFKPPIQFMIRMKKGNCKTKKIKRLLSAPITSFITPISTPIDLPNIDKLNHELYNLYTHLLSHKKEINFRYFLCMNIKQHVFSVFPNVDVKFFGSSECNLYLPLSDIDCVIFCDPKESPYLLNTLVKTLRKAWFIDPSFILYLRKARVPVVKCRSKRHSIGIDIIINNAKSIEQTNFVNKTIEEIPVLRPICLLLKYFLKSRNLHESCNGGLCSYAQFLMVLSFVQLHPILQQNVMQKAENLGTIMMDFFQYFGFDFPYESVTINVANKCYESHKISNAIISIEDPVNVGFDVGRNCTRMLIIRDVFRHAYTVMDLALKSEPDKTYSLLNLWMRLNYEEENCRKKIIEGSREYNIVT